MIFFLIWQKLFGIIGSLRILCYEWRNRKYDKNIIHLSRQDTNSGWQSQYLRGFSEITGNFYHEFTTFAEGGEGVFEVPGNPSGKWK